jgi:hypothetical protein
MVRTHLPRRWTILFLLGVILVLSLPISITHAAELVVNGGFESGDFSGWVVGDNGVGGLFGWTVSGATTYPWAAGINPASGSFLPTTASTAVEGCASPVPGRRYPEGQLRPLFQYRALVFL